MKNVVEAWINKRTINSGPPKDLQTKDTQKLDTWIKKIRRFDSVYFFPTPVTTHNKLPVGPKLGCILELQEF